MTSAFFSIGHSTHPLEEFIVLLKANAIEALADVRRFPHSRTNPQFNIETLPKALAAEGISYQHMPALGGRRSHANGETSPNTFWENASFRSYADYAMSAEFGAALQDLLEFGTGCRTAIMCSEALWWRCHRRIVADYLLTRGLSVTHISANGKLDAATVTPAAHKTAAGILIYRPHESA